VIESAYQSGKRITQRWVALPDVEKKRSPFNISGVQVTSIRKKKRLDERRAILTREGRAPANDLDGKGRKREGPSAHSVDQENNNTRRGGYLSATVS